MTATDEEADARVVCATWESVYPALTYAVGTLIERSTPKLGDDIPRACRAVRVAVNNGLLYVDAIRRMERVAPSGARWIEHVLYLGLTSFGETAWKDSLGRT